MNSPGDNMTNADAHMQNQMSDFENYNLEDEENGGKRQTLWSLFPYVLTMPTSGWERVKKCGPPPDVALLRFLLPISILSGASELFTLIYQAGQHEFPDILVTGFIFFASYFLGYYLALVFAKIFLPKAAKFFPSSAYGKLLTMTGVATLALFHMLYKILPFFDFIIEFFPIWTIFLIFKGMRYSDITPEKNALSMGVMCVVTIACPEMVEWVFTLFA